MDYVWYGMKLSTHGTRMETFSVSDDDFPCSSVRGKTGIPLKCAVEDFIFAGA
ncbi:hypothetical protein [Allobaculum sp. Allo2]|uniref:hypothetical protein n=1 Tax=Allobaculum sp. Allo2 TaxID=2853432 RepID=UPI001F60EA80|nr:hypothetical protein [Allobaculum sp. Allo2]UNT93581.1 hypothetical protein KWG61_01970 [Allobaculum sp. Allo2]